MDGLALGVTVVPVLWALSDDPGSDLALSAVVLVSVVAGASVVASAAAAGGLWGRRVLRAPARMGTGSILVMSVVAVVVGAYLLATGVGVTYWPLTPDGTALLVGLFYGTVGIILFGLPALLVVVPHAVAWRSPMRRVAAEVA
ncbi:MAG: hypothetical protein LH650_10630 [Chloroflexi bacterium]|nr:hypothetical protein [Chloroflexota bacterium]